jgi:hypothetical protein
MRRSTNVQIGSGFLQIQNRARQLLLRLQREVRVREAELRRLREEESKIAILAGQRSVAANKSARSPSAKSGGRVNWRVVLQKLPPQFKAADIRAVPGLRDKRPSDVSAAITRWIDAKMVKRKTRGLYLRVSAKK